MSAAVDEEEDSGRSKWRRTIDASEAISLSVLIVIIGWMQFPLGSARPWAWSLLVLMIAAAWCAWLPSAFLNMQGTLRMASRAAWPVVLMLAVLTWAYIQAAGWSPASWHHPIWNAVGDGLATSGAGAISVNPYDTITEFMKLLSYLAVGWLAFVLARHHNNADRLFFALFVTGVGYAIYGIILSALGTSQITLLEGFSSQYGRAVTGAFGAKNSFATFAGISFIVAICLFVREGTHEVVSRRGARTLIRTATQFAFGSGAPYLIGSLLILSALIASASRAGLVATFLGSAVSFALALHIASRKKSTGWAMAGGILAVGTFLGLLMLDGASLAMRFEALTEIGRGGSEIELRPIMWAAATKAIALHPFIGIGLGAYHDAYHLYATQFVPYVVDRAHNDYLELASGLGLPAALVWIFAMTLIVWRCAIGALRRRRRQTYAVAAVGTSALLAAHSIVDFSLQMPAVAITYAIVLGVGAAQSYATRE